MAINPNDYRVRPGKKLHLKKWPTRVKAPFKTKAQYATRLAATPNDESHMDGDRPG